VVSHETGSRLETAELDGCAAPAFGRTRRLPRARGWEEPCRRGRLDDV